MSSVKDFLERYVKASDEDKLVIVLDAENKLNNLQLKAFKKELKVLDGRKMEHNDDSDEDSSESDEEDTSKTTAQPVARSVSEEKASDRVKAVTDAESDTFWSKLESMTGEEHLDEQVVRDFQYVGFDPNVIMKAIISMGRKAKKSQSEILSDIAKMCTIAIIKGSITDNNLKKMSDEGKQSYSSLEAVYSLKKGGSRGVAPDVVTIARVGAAFPGSMMKILMLKPELAKRFSGPFGSKILPSYLRHQSAAACIPETLESSSKDFLLGLITAYTSDQSKTISKSKDKASDLYERQENFITQTHSSSYPSEAVRKTIFKSWTLASDYNRLKQVGDTIAKSVTGFEVVSRESLQQAFNAV
nr:MAG: nucleocapsid protein [Sanya phenuivirus 1]